MNNQASEELTAQVLEEAHSQESLRSEVQTASDPVPRTIRYMDNDTFRRSLDKVLDAHGRLLAKLAE